MVQYFLTPSFSRKFHLSDVQYVGKIDSGWIRPAGSSAAGPAKVRPDAQPFPGIHLLAERFSQPSQHMGWSIFRVSSRF
jgi:hypothetical protein